MRTSSSAQNHGQMTRTLNLLFLTCIENIHTTCEPCVYLWLWVKTLSTARTIKIIAKLSQTLKLYSRQMATSETLRKFKYSSFLEKQDVEVSDISITTPRRAQRNCHCTSNPLLSEFLIIWDTAPNSLLPLKLQVNYFFSLGKLYWESCCL